MTPLSLAGRRVIEMGGYVASPYAASILGHLGADIVKVEPPEGDPTRKVVRNGPGGSFIAYGSGKKSVCIDLRTGAGYAAFGRLLKSADILLQNLSPRSTRQLKLTEADCRAINPDLLYCHIRGYGRGPQQDEIASNPIIEAATGVMYVNQIDGRPTRLGPSYLDMFAGAYAVIGILGALLAAKPGIGSISKSLELGLYETGLHVAAKDLAGAQLNAGMAEGTFAPEFVKPGYGAYRTSDDRWIYLLMLGDHHWKKFCSAMGLPDGDDPSLTTAHQRQQRSPFVEHLVEKAIGALTYDEAAGRLQAVGFGCTEVMAPNEVLDAPQASQPDKTSSVEFDGRQFRLPNFPLRGDMFRSEVTAPPPALGAHTRAVLRELGYTDVECEAMIAAKAVIASR